MFEDSVTVILDKERHLKLTLGGMKRFRQETGIDLLKGGNLDSFTEDHITAFIWSCLLHEDRKLTLEDVGYMLNPDNLNAITDAMMKAWKLAMPESEGVPAPNL
jgi:hypothetical protein